jgi:hypothetical protein
MADRAISPIVRIQVGQILMRRWKCSPEKAIEISEELIEQLRANGLDIVRSDWVVPEPIVVAPARAPIWIRPPMPVRKSFWDGVADLAESLESYSWAPWKPYEKEN